MNQFNDGIDYAFKFVLDNLIGCDVNGTLVSAITKQQLENLHRKIPKKCDFCSEPCQDNWCSTTENNT